MARNLAPRDSHRRPSCPQYPSFRSLAITQVRAASGTRQHRAVRGGGDGGGDGVDGSGPRAPFCCGLFVCCPLCLSCRRRRRRSPAAPQEQPELGALPQPEFPPRLRDLLMLLSSPPGEGRFGTTWRSPASFHSGPPASRPQLGLPAPSPPPPPRRPLPPPPPLRVNGSAGRSRSVTRPRRHKERSKQAAGR